MNATRNFELRKKAWKDLEHGVRMYGENEPPEMQLENMWEIVDIYTGQKLLEPKRDLSEFERGDILYPSMRKPEVQDRWERNKREWEKATERYQLIKRMAHARFMFGNPDLKLAQDLKDTDYGKELATEFGVRRTQPAQTREHVHPTPQRQPQAGTGADLHDEFERDGLEFDPEDPIRVTPFAVPGAEEPFSVLATARNEDGRIIAKSLALAPLNHDLKYEYDAGGRLHKVWKDERLIEEYLYGKRGERYFGATPQTGQRRFLYGPGLRLEKAGNIKYSYDDNGRLLMKQDGSDVTTYEYHHSGQLQQINLPDGRRISYIIDPRGMRMAKQIDGKTVESYGWHDFTTLVVVVDGEGQNRKEFAYDAEGDPIAMLWNNEVYYFASDQVGTIYMVANSRGDEVKRIICDSFGNSIVDTNERVSIPLGFAAGLHDRDTGLVHFGHREYDPAIGRFIQPDPIGLEGGDVDVYGYCADDPVHFLDRVGLFSGLGSAHTGANGRASLGFSNFDGNRSESKKSSPVKSSVQHAREMEAKAKSLGYSTNLSNGPGGGDSSPSKSSAQHAREMEAKAENLGYNAGLNNSRGDGGTSTAKSSMQHARDMETHAAIARAVNNTFSPSTDVTQDTGRSSLLASKKPAQSGAENAPSVRSSVQKEKPKAAPKAEPVKKQVEKVRSPLVEKKNKSQQQAEKPTAAEATLATTSGLRIQKGEPVNLSGMMAEKISEQPNQSPIGKNGKALVHTSKSRNLNGLKGNSIEHNTTIDPMVSPVTVGMSSSYSEGANATDYEISGGRTSKSIKGLKQPITNSVGITQTKALGEFDVIPDVVNDIFDYFLSQNRTKYRKNKRKATNTTQAAGVVLQLPNYLDRGKNVLYTISKFFLIFACSLVFLATIWGYEPGDYFLLCTGGVVGLLPIITSNYEMILKRIESDGIIIHYSFYKIKIPYSKIKHIEEHEAAPSFHRLGVRRFLIETPKKKYCAYYDVKESENVMDIFEKVDGYTMPTT